MGKFDVLYRFLTVLLKLNQLFFSTI